MPAHSEQKLFPYTPEQMFDMVIEVDKYPQFLPWCLGARINDQSEGLMNADLVVGNPMFRETFRSEVIFDRPHKIEVKYQDGPMKHLYNHWVFSPTDDGQCLVDFEVDFSFKSRMFQGIVNQFFNQAVHRMIYAFEARAKKLYGGK